MGSIPLLTFHLIMARQQKDNKTSDLFPDLINIEDIDSTIKEIKFKGLTTPVWTTHKARLIALYLRYFVMITRHGTYIDGFAGPQEPNAIDTWSANLVLSNEPRWLRNFYLCELDTAKVALLSSLIEKQPPRNKSKKEPKRNIILHSGDFNQKVDLILQDGKITEKEAAFALLDQRTFECHWSTVCKLANHKKGQKIEIFYFLALKWLHRSLGGIKTTGEETVTAWWGNDGWKNLKDINQSEIQECMRLRFLNELGYKYAYAWPIWERNSGCGSIMYSMIHATDHDEAPKLMHRAYCRAVVDMPNAEQFELSFGTC